jgi:hypothetical protein
MSTVPHKAKPYDIRWPLTPKVLEDINANFDALFRAGQASAGQTNTNTVVLAGTTGLPAGSVTGQVPRYNATTHAWETASEPFAFKGLILTPVLTSLIDAEGAIYYDSATKSVMVCTEI